ncbi:MAG: BON domain-containing protein [Anaerolineae bacterium]|nr:BON domain-containing protein [Anaerolineae bacterium]
MASYPIGSEVRARNGIIGRLNQVVVDQHTGEVTDLVVGLRGGTTSVVLPRSVVARWDESGITVNLLMEDLRWQRVYQPTDFAPCDPSLAAVREGEALAWRDRYGAGADSRPAVAGLTPERVAASRPPIGRGTRAFVKGKPVGSLDHVLVDRKTGEITHLILQAGEAGASSVVVPVERVESVQEDGAHLNLSEEEWDVLVRYAPRQDSAVVSEVRSRLAEVGCPLDELDVTAERGVVTLRGPAYDLETKRAADRAARGVEGVVDVEDELTVDTGVAADVMSALAHDPRTSLAHIEVVVNRGTVTLRGVVASEQESRAAEEIAEQVNGVQMVINELEENPNVRDQPEGVFVIHPQQWRVMGQ